MRCSELLFRGWFWLKSWISDVAVLTTLMRDGDVI
jgi:hypothetical protein